MQQIRVVFLFFLKSQLLNFSSISILLGYIPPLLLHSASSLWTLLNNRMWVEGACVAFQKQQLGTSMLLPCSISPFPSQQLQGIHLYSKKYWALLYEGSWVPELLGGTKKLFRPSWGYHVVEKEATEILGWLSDQLIYHNTVSIPYHSDKQAVIRSNEHWLALRWTSLRLFS